MPSAPATRASDKQQACKKLTSLLQKDYGRSVPKIKLPVLETMLFAVCLEDNSWEAAEAGYEKLLKSYFDLNEIRVSSVPELERTLSNLKEAAWKGLRIKSILRFVFESTYTFDFEKLARLTLESAQKRLKKIDYISPFISSYTLQQVLGSHVVCLDEGTHRATVHLGIVPPDSSIESASEFLKAGVKKADASGFIHLLRCFATDPKFADRITDEYDEEEFDVLKVADRLATLKAPRKRKKVVKKAVAKAKKNAAKAARGQKAAAKSSAAKTTPAKARAPLAKKKTAPAKKKTAKAAPAKKKATKSKVAKSSVSRKKQGKKKTAVKKTAVKKKAVKKKAVKKTAVKKKAVKKKAPKRKK
jgi:endonuclease-3